MAHAYAFDAADFQPAFLAIAVIAAVVLVLAAVLAVVLAVAAVAAVAVWAAQWTSDAAAQKTELLVYTALETVIQAEQLGLAPITTPVASPASLLRLIT